MLKPQALANSFALTTAIFYLVLYVLRAFAYPFFRLILNSQFYGADIASQIPKMGLAGFLGILIAVSVFAWIFGYLVAIIYNKYAQNE